jgi:hypothetical protein
LLLKKRERDKEIYFFGNSKITSNTGVRDNNKYAINYKVKKPSTFETENFETLIKKYKGQNYFNKQNTIYYYREIDRYLKIISE